MEEENLFLDARLGYTHEMRNLYTQALLKRIPAIRPQVGQFLSLLVALKAPKLVLEIGTGSGYSTLWILRYLPEGGKIITIERDKNRFCDALAMFYQRPVEVVLGKAEDFLCQCEERFDMIFLDAEKRSYPRLFPLLSARLQNRGILVVDNLLGEHLHQERKTPLPAKKALEDFYEAIQASSQFRVFAFSWEDGFLVAERL